MIKMYIYSFLKNNKGVTVIEYSLLASVLSISVIGSAQVLGVNLENSINCISTLISDSSSSCGASSAGAGAGSILSDSDFDDAVVMNNGGRWNTYNNGDDIFDGWQVTSGTVDIHSGKLNWHNGTITNHIDLDGRSPGSMAKTLETIPGTEYTLSFDYAKHPSAANRLRDFTVSDGATSQDFTANTTTNWENGSFTFTATDTSTDLSFTSNSHSGSIGALLDNINITQN